MGLEKFHHPSLYMEIPVVSYCCHGNSSEEFIPMGIYPWEFTHCQREVRVVVLPYTYWWTESESSTYPYENLGGQKMLIMYMENKILMFMMYNNLFKVTKVNILF